MSDDPNKPVVRLGLKHLDGGELVLDDPLLSRVALVRALGDAARTHLGQGRVRRLARGARVYGEGDDAASVFLLLRGEVTILAGEAASAVPAVHLAPGDVFGAGAALGAGERKVAAAASAEVEVLEIPAGVLAPLAGSDPAVKAALEAARKRCEGAAGDLEDFLDRW